MKIEITELGLAYRRVKADLYYTKYANSVKLLRFEKNFVANLDRLHAILVEERFPELYSSFCHGWRIIPKSVKLEDEDKTTILVGDELRRVSRCDLRIIEDLPIEFHIVTQLWIDRVGGVVERAMSDRSFGNRIRCHGSHVNVLYPGTFKFWMKQYRSWHNDGLAIIRKQLDAGKSVAVLSTDFTAFYHNLSPDFIENCDLWNQLGLQTLSQEDKKLTGLVVNMLKKWAESTPLGVGLPVGCSISSVLANVALTLLDRKLESLKGIVYYGRYVDDIILAVENVLALKSQEGFIDWLCSQVSNLHVTDKTVSYQLNGLNLAKGCSLSFQKEKTKVFFFNGKDGKDFIVSLEHQIHKRTSEWRSLPELPDDPEELIKSILSITDSHGVEVDKLRQAEEASIRRAAFAMKLSDFADYALCLDASDWSAQRNAFIKAVSIYFTTVQNYFELSRYFPRLLGLSLYGISVPDDNSFSIVDEMLKRVAHAVDKAFEGDLFVSARDIKSLDIRSDYRDILTYQVVREFSEAVVSAVRDDAVRERAFLSIQEAFPRAAGVAEELPSYDELLFADLAQSPYKTILFSTLDIVQDEYKSESHSIKNLSQVVPRDLYENAVNFLKARREWDDNILKRGAISGFVFPTRKLSRIELLAIIPNPYSKDSDIGGIIDEYLRLVSYANIQNVDIAPSRTGAPVLINVLDRSSEESPDRGVGSKGTVSEKVHIALAYWRMTDDDWRFQVNGQRNPNNSVRFSRLMKLTNNMLRATSGEGRIKFDYILYPELAMPWRWFLLVEKKIRHYRVSLISGVEYIRSTRKHMLRNEVWCGLTYRGDGFPDSLLVKVRKTCPAEEERHFLNMFGWVLDSVPPVGGFQAGDVIQHVHDQKTLFFSVLICSDLTNIDLRSRLRGRIDLLCVPAWNQDVKTFNALVTASAYDLHSYVALCNNGQFGDTRIRGPFAKDYERDIVQLKGGNNDYWVVGTVDADAIRRFHVKCPAPHDPKFKPLPVGFKISKERRRHVVEMSVDEAVKHFKYVKVEDSSLVVTIPHKNGKLSSVKKKFGFSILKSKGMILQQVGTLLLTRGMAVDVVKEFLVACKECIGIDVGDWTERDGSIVG